MTEYEIEVIPGLEESVENELRSKAFRGVEVVGRPREGRIAIRFRGNPTRLNSLRSAVAVHQVLSFDIPRPLGLLGHQNLTRLLDVLQRVIATYRPDTFRAIHLSAAGAESEAFVRLRQELATHLHLEASTTPAQLQIAIYPASDRRGWKVAVRLSPVPLSARSWRICNLPGALNATIANAMVRLAGPKPEDRFLNLCCGSGTLIVERLEVAPAKLAVGVDLSPDALACARANLEASGHAGDVLLTPADATQLQHESGTFDTIVTDLPYGQLVGSDVDIRALYRGVIAEATRLIVPRGHFIAITTRKKLFDEALEPVRGQWHVETELDLKVPYPSGYIRPVVYALVRTDEALAPAT